jgi:membrane-associated phospholipid phosphatase
MAATNALTTPVHKLQPRKDVFSGLRAPGLLARWPVIGLILFIFGSLAFAGLTINLFAQGPLLAWDRALAHTLPAIGLKSPPFVRVMMDTGFYLGKEVIMVADILLALYFIYKKYWQELAMVAIGWLGSALIFYALSTLIGRVRPPTMIWIIVNIPGFPSGHAVATVTFYGLMAYLFVPKMPSAFWKAVVVAVSLIIIGFIGFSRIFTGGHYLTDILAGYAVGVAWSGAVYTLIEIYFQGKRIQNVKKE